MMQTPILVGSLLLFASMDFMVRADDAVPDSAAVVPPAIAKNDVEFFEKSIRPLLVAKCYECHSADADDIKGELLLDSRQGIAAGGASGAIVSGNDPDASLLIQAVHWDDSSLQMPPDGRLSEQEIAALERWVSLGVPDPREASTKSTPKEERKIDLEAGRSWWAFQPVEVTDVPTLDDSELRDSVASNSETHRTSWPKKKIDYFVLSKLAEQNLTPSPPAERDVLIRRSYLDLTGLRPTFEEVQSFVNDDSPDAHERLIERLLESRHYGERWGRYWLDVVRYGEDNFTGEATTPSFPFAWRYRDWVIEAINNDMPYDHFVKLQLAADLMPDIDRRDMVALGFLGAAPRIIRMVGYRKTSSKRFTQTTGTNGSMRFRAGCWD